MSIPIIRHRARRVRWMAAAGFCMLVAGIAQQVAAPSPAAAAGITKVQAGPLVNSTSGSLALTVPAATKAGDLLVATVFGATTTPAFSGPTGWAKATSKAGTAAETEIWYLANTSAGITSATFTSTAGPVVAGSMSEWSGASTSSPLDQTGTSTGASATSVSVSTAGSTAATGEVGVTSFVELLSASNTVTFTPASGWTNLTSSAGTAYNYQGASDSHTGLAQATASELETSSRAGTWTAVVATFKAPCTGGALTLAPPASAAFPGLVLSGRDQTTTASAVLTANDQTASGAGWKISGTSTTFTNAGGKTLPTTATTATAGTSTAAAGNCSLPTNGVTYPVTLPAGSSPPTAVKLYNAAAGTGSGPSNVSITFTLTVPARAFAGTYTSTWTFTVASGP